MHRKRTSVLTFIFTLIVALQSSFAAAQPAAISLKQATEVAKQQQGGEVIKSEAAELNGRTVYKIRLVKEGRVKDVLVDSQSGKVIKP